MVDQVAPAGPDVPDELAERIIEIIKTGYTITAIKELRSSTGLGLREAKLWVDEQIEHLYGNSPRESEPPA